MNQMLPPPITTEEALAMLRGGTDGIRRWNEFWAPFRQDGPDLTWANLVMANLSGIEMESANLVGARLYEADLTDARLLDADLSHANLEAADLSRTDLSLARLVKANLRCARFYRTNLASAVLTDAAFDSAWLDQTTLVDVDLAPLCRAEDLSIGDQCIVDHRSIIRSAHEPGLKRFLRSIGLPEVFIEYSISCAQSLTAIERRSILLSTFISYGGSDEEFATKLNRALLDQGVTTFLFKEDAVPGMRLSRMMHEGVRRHDRIVLICSKTSLDRAGVLNEIQETLDREAADGGREYLIPIRLDDHVFTEWTPARPYRRQSDRGSLPISWTHRIFRTALQS
jgi:hypothetical protein